jgi:hypothetical protein
MPGVRNEDGSPNDLPWYPVGISTLNITNEPEVPGTPSRVGSIRECPGELPANT